MSASNAPVLSSEPPAIATGHATRLSAGISTETPLPAPAPSTVPGSDLAAPGCTKCGIPLPSRAEAAAHAATTHVKCAGCDVVFVTQGVHDKHRSQRPLAKGVHDKHRSQRPLAKGVHDKHRSQRPLAKGSPVHSAPLPIACPVCAHDSRSKYDHAQHLLVHTGENEYSCPDCKRPFTSARGLDHHRSRAAGCRDKPYRAPVAFCNAHWEASDLVSGFGLGTDGKPPPLCRHDGCRPVTGGPHKRFRDHASLAAHIDSQHSSDSVRATARSAGTAKAAQRRKKDAARFRCDTLVDGERCARAYADKYRLTRHQESHKSEQLHKCELIGLDGATVCGRSFSDACGLRRHSKKAHMHKTLGDTSAPLARL